MPGYDPTYRDIVDYIVRITERIWEHEDVGYIYETYTADCRVYDDSGPHYGVDRVMDDTLQSIHAFPDTRHYAADVIWAGGEDQGFATSHRAVNVGHHLGPWRWGPPSGRRVNLWVIANCVSRANRIYEEWVLYNTTARLAQCGIDVEAAARAYGNKGLSPPLSERELGEITMVSEGRQPAVSSSGDGFNVEQALRSMYHEAFNRRNLSALGRLYAPDVRWHGAGDRQGHGVEDVRNFVRSLLATFPDLGVRVDDVYWMGNENEGFSVSVRWMALGTHRGHCLYGAPTGRRVHLWGLSQMYLEGNRVVEEWTLFNEFDVLAQILRDEAEEGAPGHA